MSKSNVRGVHLVYHREDGTWWADSKDMPGFSAAGDTFTEVRKLAREGVRFYFDDNAVSIVGETDEGGTPLYSEKTILLPFPARNSQMGEENEQTSLSSTKSDIKREYQVA